MYITDGKRELVIWQAGGDTCSKILAPSVQRRGLQFSLALALAETGVEANQAVIVSNHRWEERLEAEGISGAVVRRVVLISSGEPDELVRAWRFGIRIFLGWEEVDAYLLDAVRASELDRPYCSPELLPHFMGRPAPDEDGQEVALPGQRLTARQAEVALLAADGLRNEDIAQRLFISLPTVKTHLRGAFDKLGVETRYELRTWHTALRRSAPPMAEG